MDSRYLFPNDRLFQNIFEVGRRHDANRTIIRDHATGRSATMAQLLTDAGKVKLQLAQQIPEKTLQEVRAGTEAWVALVLPPGYAFTVGMLAALALGAGVIPLSADIVLEEAIYFAGKAKASAMLHGNSSEALVLKTVLHHQQWDGPRPISLNVESLLESSSGSSPCGILDADLCLDSKFCPSEESSAVLIFTSGTTGLPKGVVHTRKFFRLNTLPGVGDGITNIHVSPTHWILGFWIVTLGLTSGACLEFSRSVYTPEWFVDRIKTPGRYGLIAPPSLWAGLRQFLMEEASISSIDDMVPGGPIESQLRQQMAYLASAGTGGLPTPSGVFQFFSRALPSCQLLDSYGTTELGQIVAYTNWEMKLERSKHFIGTLSDHVKAKVNASGEILLKSDPMFKGYLSDPERTRAALDDEGYFRTGDCGYLEGKDLYLEGRFGFDVIRFDGWKILAQEVEDGLLELADVTEALVLPISDDVCGQRVGAIIYIPSLQASPSPTYSLTEVRASMAERLPVYKLPTALALSSSPLPRTDSGKMAKKAAMERFFPAGCLKGGTSDLQVWDLENGSQPRGRRAWDWAGVNAG